MTIPGLKPGTAVTMHGEPIRMGLTIPKTCINRPASLAWTQLLLSNKGKDLMEKAGKRSLKPVFGGDLRKVPPELAEFQQ